MSELWSLPGYDVQELVGFGATGEVWRARELSTGDTVALKRLKAGADPDAVQALRHEACLLATLDTPYVVRLRAVVGEGAEAVLVLDHAPGGSLATLLARRGSLEPGEVVTIGAPLAQALAAAHAVALVHGDVSPANVLFTAGGMPLLADLGVSRIVGERLATVDGTAHYLDPAVAAGGDPDAAADVWALAALCHHLLAGMPPHEGDSVGAVLSAAVTGSRAPLGLLAPSAPRALVSAIEAGLVADPAQRPDAAAFASLLRRAHAAAPVRLAGAPAAAATPAAIRPTHIVRVGGVVEPAQHGRRLVPRNAVLVAVIVVLVALGATAGWLSGRGGEPLPVAFPPAVVPSATTTTSPPTPGVRAPPGITPGSPVPFGPDWVRLLDGLDASRSAAFQRADVAGLAAVYVPASDGMRSDAALVEQLAVAGRTAHGVRHTVRSVDVLAATDRGARLEVVDVLAPYEVRDGTGEVVSRAPARGEATYVVELTRTAEGWRLLSVTPG